MAWREEGARVSKVLRVKLRAGRQAYHRTLKAPTFVADDCHAVKLYMDHLSVAIDELLAGKSFKEPSRPTLPKQLVWQKRVYGGDT